MTTRLTSLYTDFQFLHQERPRLILASSLDYCLTILHDAEISLCSASHIIRQNAEWRSALCLDPSPPSFVHHKVNGSYISWTVWSRITKFYMDIRIDLVYSHTTNGVTTPEMAPLATSGRKLSWKTVENAPYDRWLRVEFLENGLGEITTFYILITHNQPHKPAGYGVTSCFQSDAKCN